MKAASSAPPRSMPRSLRLAAATLTALLSTLGRVRGGAGWQDIVNLGEGAAGTLLSKWNLALLLKNKLGDVAGAVALL